jgi:hypothetical protein
MTQKTLAAIPAGKLERFLKELANLKRESNAIERFQRRFADMLADVPPARKWRDGVVPGIRAWGGPIRSRSRSKEEGVIEEISAFVESIWRAPTSQEKQRRVLLQHRFFLAWKPTFLLAPDVAKDLSPPGPFEQAILHLLKSAGRALVCGNPDCPAPLFFRPGTKRRQRYCSPKCAGVGQAVAKRKWWANHGQQWRKNQHSGKERKRGGKHGSRKAG